MNAASASASPRPALAVTIDLDPLDCYAAIHGLGVHACDASQRRFVLDVCVPRALQQLADAGVQATFFAVGRELADATGQLARARLREIIAAGHEVASHSFAHHYDLARLPADEVAADLALADAHLADATGVAVVGFRSPGYDMSPMLAACLQARRYAYDSSLLPAPAYWLAKAGVLAAMKARGRASAAVITEPRALRAPRMPFLPALAAPWRAARGLEEAAGYLEIPMLVTPFTRLPVIGTSLALAPAWLADRVLSAVAGDPLIHLEFHGIDWAGQGDEEVAFLRRVQPDTRRLASDKRHAFSELLARLTPDRASMSLASVAATPLDAPAHRSAR
ncbi:MAG: polysaccharide deacetylase family protein [Myxococcales bacterium]|nr:polysaccharide deacetylase family protein [Myxococcales bacterium]